MSVPKQYNLPKVFKGDSVDVFTITVTNDSGAGIDLSDYEVTLTLKRLGKVYRTLKIWSGISVSYNVVTFSIPAFTIAGKYSYDTQFKNGNLVQTHLYWTIEVVDDITK